MLGQRVCSPSVLANAFVWCNSEAHWVCIRVLPSDAAVVSYQSSCELEWRRILFPNVWHRLNSGLVIPASAAWQQQAAKYSKAVVPSVASVKACFCQRTSYIKEIKCSLAFAGQFYEKCRILWISWQKLLLNIIYGILADCTLAKPVTFEERHLRISSPLPLASYFN